MKPKHFVILAILAAVSTVLAITSYAANNTWSPGRVSGARMFPALASNAGTVAAIELRQGPKLLTVEKGDGGAWRIKERGGYPVPADKVRSPGRTIPRSTLIGTLLRAKHTSASLGSRWRMRSGQSTAAARCARSRLWSRKGSASSYGTRQTRSPRASRWRVPTFGPVSARLVSRSSSTTAT